MAHHNFDVNEKLWETTTNLGPLSVPNEFYSKDYLTDDQEEQIENWLGRVAQYLASLGFRPPHYEATSNGGQTYEVHVHPLDGGAYARAANGSPISRFRSGARAIP